MEAKKESLVKSVKHAVKLYGISGLSTRNLADVAGVNDANIYRFFKNKEELLLEAYKHESGKLIDILLKSIEDLKNSDIDSVISHTLL